MKAKASKNVKISKKNGWLTFPVHLSPLSIKAPRRHKDTNKGRVRLSTGGPLSSMLSEAFRVIRYQKYREGVVRAHSGSAGTWLWTGLLDRVTPPLFFRLPPSPVSSSFHNLPLLYHSLLLSPLPNFLLPLCSPPFSSFTSSSPKPLAFTSKGHFTQGTGNWKD